jgi:hypothetical protein
LKVRFLRLAIVALAALAFCGAAGAAPGIAYGVQDDAWLASGPGTIDHRVQVLDALGVKIVRYTLRWDQIARTRPAMATWSGDPAYTWGSSDEVLKALHAAGIRSVVGVYGSPRWANGGKSPNWAPLSGSSVAAFMRAAAERFPWVRDWLIWNEPNKTMFLRPNSPRVYVQQLLNPAYAALHAVSARMRVGGGVTAPRAGSGGTSPITWIRGMRAAHARLDAYAHNPYPERPAIEGPGSGGCRRCSTITMATLDKLQRETFKAWGMKRLWLTEYGYQARPPDRMLGVPVATQARYINEAALKTYRASRVDMLIHFLVRDDPRPAGWQSGFFTMHGSARPSAGAFLLPLAQVSRRGLRTVLWGQVRAHRGQRPYRLQQYRGGGWRWIGGTYRTASNGAFQRTVRADRGSKLRTWSPLDHRYSPTLVVR